MSTEDSPSVEAGVEESDGTCWACEQASDTLVQQLCPACSVSPPDARLELFAYGFAPLRDSLAKYQIENYDIWHIPCKDANELFDLGDLDADSLQAPMAEILVRRDREEIVPGGPQFIAGDHVSHGGHFRKKGYDTLLVQTAPLEDGVWMNQYPGTAYKWHASTCHISSVPPIERAARGYNEFLASVGLPPSNIGMDRFYADGGRYLGWHSEEIKDLHELGLIAVMRTGRRRFQVRDKETSRMVFDRVLEAFDWVIMTAHGSNLITEHCVPKEDGAPAAGSWSFRTSVACVAQGTMKKRLGSTKQQMMAAEQIQRPFPVSRHS